MTPKEVRQEWVKELRSGKYKQGKRRLRSAQDEYCCLGVLCEMAVNHKIVEPPTNDTFCYTYTDNSDNTGQKSQTAGLPFSIKKWAGVRDTLGSFNKSGLSVLNDRGESFERIADVIEAEPDGLCF